MCINKDNSCNTDTLAALAIDLNVRIMPSFKYLYKFYVLKHEEKEKLTISEYLNQI